MVEQSRNLSLGDRATRTLERVSGVHAFKHCLGPIKSDLPFPFKKIPLSLGAGLMQITTPMWTEEFNKEILSQDDTFSLKDISVRGIYALDLLSAMIPITLLAYNYEFATTVVAAKIAVYNTLLAALPEAVEMIKQRSSLQK